MQNGKACRMDSDVRKASGCFWQRGVCCGGGSPKCRKTRHWLVKKKVWHPKPANNSVDRGLNRHWNIMPWTLPSSQTEFHVFHLDVKSGRKWEGLFWKVVFVPHRVGLYCWCLSVCNTMPVSVRDCFKIFFFFVYQKRTITNSGSTRIKHLCICQRFLRCPV